MAYVVMATDINEIVYIDQCWAYTFMAYIVMAYVVMAAGINKIVYIDLCWAYTVWPT